MWVVLGVSVSERGVRVVGAAGGDIDLRAWFPLIDTTCLEDNVTAPQ